MLVSSNDRLVQEEGSVMSESIWIAFGIVLIVEGAGPFIHPKGWRNMVAQLASQDDNQLRRIGGCLFVAGAVMILMFG